MVPSSFLTPIPMSRGAVGRRCDSGVTQVSLKAWFLRRFAIIMLYVGMDTSVRCVISRRCAVRRLLSKLDSWVRNVTHRFLGFLEDRLALFTLLVLIAEFTFAVLFWCWLSTGESGSTTIRNFGLVVAATVGLPIAIWRSKVAERQAKTAQRGLLNERYQKGSEMLGSGELPVRLGGIYSLERLAREHPGDYHTQIMNLLCAFVRHPTREAFEAVEMINGGSSTGTAKSKKGWHEESNDRPLRVREDVQEAMWVISRRCEVRVEEEEQFWLNLTKAELSGARLIGANLAHASLLGTALNNARLDHARLEHAILIDAELYGATMFNANLNKAQLNGAFLNGAKLHAAKMNGASLSGAELRKAKLKGAQLNDASLAGADMEGANLKGVTMENTDLTEAKLKDVNLSGASLRNCIGLTQDQLNETLGSSHDPPKHLEVNDANTYEPLVWKGRIMT